MTECSEDFSAPGILGRRRPVSQSRCRQIVSCVGKACAWLAGKGPSDVIPVMLFTSSGDLLKVMGMFVLMGAVVGCGRP